MEQNLHTPEAYDFRQYDRIWQRVAPGLEPYPPPRSGVEPVMAESARMPQTPMTQMMQAAPSVQAAPATPQPLSAVSEGASSQLRQESQLPGAEPNPCCMGTAAAEMLEVLTGFIEEELGDQRQIRAVSRQAPSWARQHLRDMAAEAGGRAKRLLAVYYLITGTCYRPGVICGQVRVNGWCAALRELYHAAACSGFNYARAAEGTADPCLSGLLSDLSAQWYRQADDLLSMLERSLRA